MLTVVHVSEQMLSTASVAAELDCTERQVRGYLRRGLLAGVRLLGQWRVPLSEVERVQREGLRSRREPSVAAPEKGPSVPEADS